MSRKHAPIHVRSQDLAVWMHGHAARIRGGGHMGLAAELEALARRLVTVVALALTFPVTRHEHQRASDETLVALRERMRLAHALGATSADQLRHAAGELDAIGRMLGGWRRSWRIGQSKTTPGAEAAPARIA